MVDPRKKAMTIGIVQISSVAFRQKATVALRVCLIWFVLHVVVNREDENK